MSKLDIGITQIEIEKYEDAHDTFKELSKTEPGNWRVWLGLALTEAILKPSDTITIDPGVSKLFPEDILKKVNGQRLFNPNHLGDTNKRQLAEKSREFSYIMDQSEVAELTGRKESLENAKKRLESQRKSEKIEALCVLIVGAIILAVTIKALAGNPSMLIVALGIFLGIPAGVGFVILSISTLLGTSENPHKPYNLSIEKELNMINEAKKRQDEAIKKKEMYERELNELMEKRLKNPDNLPTIGHYLKLIRSND